MRTEENTCPSQHSEHIHYNWKSQVVQCQCGVHHVSFVKATEGHCVGKVNPSELLSQHGLNIYGQLYQIKVCADWFQATKWVFHWQQGACMWNVSTFVGFLRYYAQVSILWKIWNEKHELLLFGLLVVWNTLNKIPMQGVFTLSCNSDLKQI